MYKHVIRSPQFKNPDYTPTCEIVKKIKEKSPTISLDSSFQYDYIFIRILTD